MYAEFLYSMCSVRNMAKAISLHIGVNSLDPIHYDGWEGILKGCENDARDMQAIAAACGFESKLRLSSQATKQHIFEDIRNASSRLSGGDFFFFPTLDMAASFQTSIRMRMTAIPTMKLGAYSTLRSRTTNFHRFTPSSPQAQKYSSFLIVAIAALSQGSVC